MYRCDTPDRLTTYSKVLTVACRYLELRSLPRRWKNRKSLFYFIKKSKERDWWLQSLNSKNIDVFRKKIKYEKRFRIVKFLYLFTIWRCAKLFFYFSFLHVFKVVNKTKSVIFILKNLTRARWNIWCCKSIDDRSNKQALFTELHFGLSAIIQK